MYLYVLFNAFYSYLAISIFLGTVFILKGAIIISSFVSISLLYRYIQVKKYNRTSIIKKQVNHGVNWPQLPVNCRK